MSDNDTVQNFTEGLDASKTSLNRHQSHNKRKCCYGVQQPTGIGVDI